MMPAFLMVYIILLWVVFSAFYEKDYYFFLLLALLVCAVTIWAVLLYLTTGTCWRRGSSRVRLSRLRDGRLAVTMWNRRSFAILEPLAYLWLGMTLICHPFLMAMIPPSGTRADARLRALAFVAPVLGVMALCCAFSRLVRRRGQLGVGLSPKGIYHWSQFGCCFYAWEWIKDVLTIALGYPRLDLIVAEPQGIQLNPEENFIASWPIFRRRNRRIELHYLDVNPGVVYLAVVFYLRHPELRHELATMEGVQRIQRLDFAEVVDELETTGTLRAMVDRP